MAVGRSGNGIVTEDSTARASQHGQGRFAETFVFGLVRKLLWWLSQNSNQGGGSVLASPDSRESQEILRLARTLALPNEQF
jgi:hypothetical protein